MEESKKSPVKLVLAQNKEGNNVFIYPDLIVRYEPDGEKKTKIFLEAYEDAVEYTIEMNVIALIKEIHGKDYEIIEPPEIKGQPLAVERLMDE